MPAVAPRQASLRESAAKGVGWSLVQTVGSRLLTAVTFVVLARLLEPAAFGVVAFASALVALLSVFVSQGFVQVLVQRPELERRHLDTAFWISLAFGCGLCLCTIALSWPLEAAVNLPEVGPVFRALSCGFILSGLASTQQALLQRRMAFRWLAARQLVGHSVGAVVGVTSALLGAGVWSLVAQILTYYAVAVVVLWTATRWRPGLCVTRATYREIFRFSRSVIGTGIMGFFTRRTDDFFIGALLGAVPLGVYSVAYRLLTIMLEVTIATVSVVALPTFSRLQHEIERVRSAYLTASQLSAVVAIPAFAFMTLAAPEVILVFFGDKWREAIDVMRLLSLVGMGQTLTNFNNPVLTALGRPHLVFRYMSIIAIVTVAAVALSVHWGIAAVAGALVARTWCIAAPLSIYFVTRHLGFGVREYLAAYAAPLLASGIMLCFAAPTQLVLSSVMSEAPRLAVMFVASVLAYVGALRLLDRALLSRVVDVAQSMISRPTSSATS